MSYFVLDGNNTTISIGLTLEEAVEFAAEYGNDSRIVPSCANRPIIMFDRVRDRVVYATSADDVVQFDADETLRCARILFTNVLASHLDCVPEIKIEVNAEEISD